MYRLTVDNVEHYIVVMRNVFSNHLGTHRKFDLKGSTVDREASEKEREKELPTLKDNDFVNEQMKVLKLEVFNQQYVTESYNILGLYRGGS